MKKIFLTVSVALFIAGLAKGYDNKTTHREINHEIVLRFKTQKSEWTEFKNYNFGFDLVKVTGPAVVASGWWKITTDDRNLNLMDWIREGGYSADEPEVPAAYRHFYDPVSVEGKTHLSDMNSALAQFNPSVDAVYWHFMGNDVNGMNDWNWHAGKDFMVKALAESNENLRSQHLAKAFRSLGEVLHNTADMGCPPHVRNDAHGGFGLGGYDPIEGGFQSSWITSYSSGKCDANLAGSFKSANTAADVNKLLASYTNKNYFSDETISGTGVESYSSRNGKKNYPSPKLEKLNYVNESFNYVYNSPSGRQLQLCNDQSVLLGYLTQNFRSYPRVTYKNSESQASDLIPSIIEAGANVVRHFIPVLVISMDIKSSEKKIDGTIKNKPTNEYPNSLPYNGKVKFIVDGKISETTTSASNGTFSVTETDKKFANAKKIEAFIELAGIMIKSDEYSLEGTTKYSTVDLTLFIPVKTKATNLFTNEVSNIPAYIDNSAHTVTVTSQNNKYTGTWNITDKDPKFKGSISITLDGEKTATVDFNGQYVYNNGSTHNYNFSSKAIPYKWKNPTQISFETNEAFKYTSAYTYVWTTSDSKRESTLVESDINGQKGGITVTLYIK